MMQHHRAYALRYEVYCLECRFLPAEAYPERRETDAFDEKSAHFVSENRRDELVGYVRMIPPNWRGRFPWQEYAADLLDGAILPNPADSAEISRLIVRADYRCRNGGSLPLVSLHDEDLSFAKEGKPKSTPVLLNLFRQMYRHSLKSDIRYWYAAMERPLARALGGMNFSFQQIGHQTDYFGPVAPYVADLRRLEINLGRYRPEILAWFQIPERDPSSALPEWQTISDAR